LNHLQKKSTVKPGNFEQKRAFFEGFNHFWATNFWKLEKVKIPFRQLFMLYLMVSIKF